MVAKKSKNNKLVAQNTVVIIDESALFNQVSAIIESRKIRAASAVNSEMTLMYWEVGQFVNSIILDNKRAEYGKKILPTLSAKLSWSHFLELLPLKSTEAQLYYANLAAQKGLSVQALRKQILRKAFERREIADAEFPEQFSTPFNVFKDPYLLDILGLQDNYLEGDLEKAILADIQTFLLEFGHGFTFVEKQKRMIIDGEDVILDLLFYNRVLKRLVAVELKLGRFKAAYKGQMELYLNWLDRYERQDGEEAPIGIILCATANREKI